MASAINQAFALFKLNYFHQFVKAFPDETALTLAKQLWFSQLKSVPPERILEAAQRVIRESEFLPNIASLLKHCEAGQHGLPDVWSAYHEACQAPEPKAAQTWSHPLVYHAGHQAGWYFLATNTEQRTFPVFEKIWRNLCERLRQGDVFALPQPASLPAPEPHARLEKEEALARLRATRALLNTDAPD